MVSLLNEVTNPGQNESQGLPTLCDLLDREGDIEVIIVARMNSMTRGVEEEERDQMIGQRPKAEKEFLFFRGNWKKDFFQLILEQQSVWQDVLKLSPKTPGKSGEEFLDKKITCAFQPSSTESR